eukprot:2436646-Pyramimonas_sp.AAC.1
MYEANHSRLKLNKGKAITGEKLKKHKAQTITGDPDDGASDLNIFKQARSKEDCVPLAEMHS